MEKVVIHCPEVPETGGPFNLAIRHRDLVYVSGLPPFEAEFCESLRAARAANQPLPKFPDLGIERETHIVMRHLKLLLEAGGSSLDHLLKVVVWLRDQNDQVAFDKIYRANFSGAEALPTRTRMQAGRTPFDCRLEIDAIGYVPVRE